MATGDKIVNLNALKAVYDSVDGEIENLKSAFGNAASQELIPYNESAHYIKTNFSVGTDISSYIATPNSSGTYCYAIVSCQPGDVFLVNGVGGSSPRLWAFIDADNKLLSVANAGISGEYLRIVAPANAAKCIINSETASYGPCYKGSLAYTLGLALKGQGLNKPTLTDADNADTNTIYTVFTASTENVPADGVLITARFSAAAGNGHAQILIGSDAKLYTRVYWANAWRQWRSILDNNSISAYAYNAMTMAMFENFGVVGDSFASGEIVLTPGSRIDYYSQSWGQIIARRNGITCTNFSQGGLSTRTWLASEYGLPLVQSSNPQNLYILALGLNDNSLGSSYIGTIADITGHSSYTDYGDTFYGNYGRIIEQIQAKAPKAKIVMMKTAFSYGNFPALDTAIGEIAEHYGLPVIDQKADEYLASLDYLDNMQNGHPTAAMYSGMAMSIERLMSECLLTNYNYFKDYNGRTT